MRGLRGDLPPRSLGIAFVRTRDRSTGDRALGARLACRSEHRGAAMREVRQLARSNSKTKRQLVRVKGCCAQGENDFAGSGRLRRLAMAWAHAGNSMVTVVPTPGVLSYFN